MQFVKINSPEEAAGELAAKLKTALTNHPVVTWLVPGGSNIPISVATLNQIPDELKKNLILAQTDERFGPPGHADSNWKQLLDAGLKMQSGRAFPILVNAGLTLEQTSNFYSTMLAGLFRASYKIGQFGIGADGHIAGIKPGTPATVATTLVAGYEASDFVRVTMTFDAIKQLNEAYAFAFGEGKKATLESLLNEHHPPMSQPAQILKSVGNCTVYNDQIGDSE